MRTRDLETGYIGQHCLGKDYGPEVRCRRCGGRGMWSFPVNEPGPSGKVLCLRCADDWQDMAGELLKKHGWRDSRSARRKWDAAFEEFLQTKPTEMDIEVHNRRISSSDSLFFGAFPHLKKLVEEFNSKQL